MSVGNEPAFPHQTGETWTDEPGLTKREFFALHIYCALITYGGPEWITPQGAIDQADRLLRDLDQEVPA